MGLKQIAGKIRDVVMTLVAVLSVCIMLFTVVSVNTFNRNDRNLFGYKFFIVLSDSMKATDFAAGDVVIIKEVDPATLQEGDIITYESTATESFGEVVTHKIRACTTDANGEPGFITYGTTTGVDDEQVVTYLYVLGKYQFHLPKVGSFFRFMRTVPGYFVCIFVPFMLLILYQGIHVIQQFRLYRAEQEAELDAARLAQQEAIAAERAMLEKERAEQQRMMQELLSMRQQMPPTAPAAPPPAPVAPLPVAPAQPEQAPSQQELMEQMAQMQAQMEAMRRQMAQQQTEPQPAPPTAPTGRKINRINRSNG